LISKLVLLGPPPNPLPKKVSEELHAQAALVRSKGVGAVVDVVASQETSQATQTDNFVALSAVRLSLLAQSAEGYAKACTALAETTVGSDVDYVDAKALLIAGADDKIGSPQVCDDYKQRLTNAADVEVLEGVGHWYVFEDPVRVSKTVDTFL
jgi:pimeloyl-ACP methyl ester carboxylesterase